MYLAQLDEYPTDHRSRGLAIESVERISRGCGARTSAVIAAESVTESSIGGGGGPPIEVCKPGFGRKIEERSTTNP